MIEGLKKHVGILTNTGVRVAVVFRKLPNDDNNCLIVETERLPDSYHDYIIQSLNSKEAAETTEFYEVLNRKTFPDGLNCLTALHQRGFLRKVPVTNVTMVPLPGHSVPLELINADIDKKVEQYKAKQKAIAEPVPVVSEDPLAVAKGLLVQAELLEKDAEAKREEAYVLAPELKPGRGRPSTPEELREQKLQERKDKRRERDRQKAAEMKVQKADKAIESKVEMKMKRDELKVAE